MEETAKIDAIVENLDKRAKRRQERREFFKLSTGFAAGAAGVMALSACGGGGNSSAPSAAVAQSATGPSDADILNFALQLEYLEANFYTIAATGSPIPASLMTGTGTQGAVVTTGAAKGAFATQLVSNYVQEIYQDELDHVMFLRSALGSSAVAMPQVDVSVNAFSGAAMAAGLITAGQTFNPYSGDEAFLIGAYIFEDVGVTAYHGAAPLLASKTYLDAAAGILAVEAYHAGLIRTALYAMGLSSTTPPAIDPYVATTAISNLRSKLDGTGNDDFGIAPAGTTLANVKAVTKSNIVDATPTTALAFDRTTGQVLRIVYGTTAIGAKGGLFFPNGLNGNITVTS